MPDFKLDHTMLRVKDLEKSLDFYTRILGMKILRQNDYPTGQFTNTFRLLYRFLLNKWYFD